MGPGVSNTTADVTISSGLCSPVESDFKLATSCMLDDPEAAAGSGLAAGVIKTGLEIISCVDEDKLLAFGVDARKPETSATEAYEFTSFIVGFSSERVIFACRRATCRQISDH